MRFRQATGTLSGLLRVVIAAAQGVINSAEPPLRLERGQRDGFPLAYSADGRRVVGGTVDGMAILWDTETAGPPLQVFRGHTDPVFVTAISANGTKVLTGGADGKVILWDARTGKQLHVAKHDDMVTAAVFSPDAARFATACRDTATLWDTNTGRQIFSFGHTAPIWGLAFSGDGQRAITNSHERTAALWDVSTGKCLQTFEAGNREILGVAISSDGRGRSPRVPKRRGGGYHGELLLWDGRPDGCCGRLIRERSSFMPASVRTGKPLSPRLDGLFNRVWGCAFVLWDAITGQKLRELGSDTQRYSQPQWSTDGKQLRCRSSRGLIVLDATNGNVLRSLEDDATLCHGPSRLMRDGRHVYTLDGQLVIWDLHTGQATARLGDAKTGYSDFAADPNDQEVVLLSAAKPNSGRQLEWWDVAPRRSGTRSPRARFPPDLQSRLPLDRRLRLGQRR